MRRATHCFPAGCSTDLSGKMVCSMVIRIVNASIIKHAQFKI